MYKFVTRTGKEIVIRYPKMSDFKSLTDWANRLSEERTFITRQGKQYTLAEERKAINKFIKTIKDKKGVYLVAAFKNKIIGMGSIVLKDNAIHKHSGGLAVSIDKNYRGEGIGRVLMQEIINESKKNLPGLKMVLLSVFAINKTAISLYRKMGFKDYGLLPKAIFYKGKYVDEIFMYKKIGN